MLKRGRGACARYPSHRFGFPKDCRSLVGLTPVAQGQSRFPYSLASGRSPESSYCELLLLSLKNTVAEMLLESVSQPGCRSCRQLSLTRPADRKSCRRAGWLACCLAGWLAAWLAAWHGLTKRSRVGSRQIRSCAEIMLPGLSRTIRQSW